MITLSNFIGGMLIGIVAEKWFNVFFAAFVWGLFKCYGVRTIAPQLKNFTMEGYVERDGWLLFGSPTLTFYFFEYMFATITAIVIGIPFFVIKLFII